MFFIGPSVNIFVYLLVSAFFVVCFYSKSEAKHPGVLPGNAVHVYHFTTNEEVHYHEVHEEQKRTEVKKTFIPVYDSHEWLPYTPQAEYRDPRLTLKTLRAPPTCPCLTMSV